MIGLLLLLLIYYSKWCDILWTNANYHFSGELQLKKTHYNSIRPGSWVESHNFWLELAATYDADRKSEPIVRPFFDKSGDIAYAPMPIGGISLYHRGPPGYAGYLSFKLHSPNLLDKLESFVTNIDTIYPYVEEEEWRIYHSILLKILSKDFTYQQCYISRINN